MADQTTANIRIVLEDASEAGGTAPAPPPTAGQAAQQQPVKSPDDITNSLAMVGEQESSSRRRRSEPAGMSSGDKYREAKQMLDSMSRGMFFAEHFGVTGMVGAAGQWLEAGQSGMKLAGAGATADAIAGPVGVAMAALGMFAMVVDKTAAGLNRMADRASHFSAEVAGARGLIEAMQTKFQMEQAGKYGGKLAEFEIEQAKIGMEWQDFMNRFLSENADWIMTLFRGIRVTVGGWSDFISHIGETIRSGNWLNLAPSELIKKFVDIIYERVRQVISENNEVQTVVGHLEALRIAADMNVMQRNSADEWMKQEKHFEMADIGMAINAVLEKEVKGEGAALVAAGRLNP